MPERFEFPEGATPIDDCSGLIPVWVHHFAQQNRSAGERGQRMGGISALHGPSTSTRFGKAR